MKKVAVLSLSLLVAAQVLATETTMQNGSSDNTQNSSEVNKQQQTPEQQDTKQDDKTATQPTQATDASNNQGGKTEAKDESKTDKSSNNNQQPEQAKEVQKPASEEKKRGIVAALVTVKSYTIDPVTGLVTRLMTSAKNRWNGYTAEQYKAVEAMSAQELSGLVTKEKFKDETLESIRALAAKQEEFTQDDIKNAQELLKKIEPGLVRKAINKAKALVRIATLGFVFAENKDEKMAVVTLRNKVNAISLAEAIKAEKELEALTKQQDELTQKINEAKQKVSNLKQLRSVKHETICTITKLQQLKKADADKKANLQSEIKNTENNTQETLKQATTK
jgi:hypothetical protein